MNGQWPLNSKWSEPRAIDLAVASCQLGRALEGRVLRVARRCRFGQPQALATYPVLVPGEADEQDRARALVPFPTLFWLTCPHIREGVGALENDGMIVEMRRRVEEDGAFRAGYMAANADYARRRVALLDDDDRNALRALGPSIMQVIGESGVGGIADPAGVKCLHMHMGHWLATDDNPVGAEVARALETMGRGLECAEGRCIPERVAAINVGSNSAKVLIADAVCRPAPRRGSGRWDPWKCAHGSDARVAAGLPMVFGVCAASRITGMSRGLESTGVLSPYGRDMAIEAVSRFNSMAATFGVRKVWMTATAAARRAQDGQLFANEIKRQSGRELEIIGGDLEARLSFAGVSASAGTAERISHTMPRVLVDDPWHCLVVDSGGLSTELMRMGPEGNLISTSLPIGAVGLTDEFVKSDPPSPGELEAMETAVRTRLEKAADVLEGDYQRLVVVGGGGAALASVSMQLEKFDVDVLHGFELDRAELARLSTMLAAVALAEREKVPGMIQPKRARVILAGTAIIKCLMDAARVTSVVTTPAGILDGMAAMASALRQ